MRTVERYAIFSIVGIVLVAQAGAAGALDWALAVVWFLVCFAVMEMSVWRVVGMSPKDFPAKIKGKITEMRGAKGNLCNRLTAVIRFYDLEALGRAEVVLARWLAELAER